MELAENVGGKRSGYMKPESFDPKFGDSAYLVTDVAKSRLRGYLRTFGYMMLCGLLLLIGGGSFFIYESVVMENPPKKEEEAIRPSGRMAPLPDPTLEKKRMHYAKEFQITAFVFVGVGIVLFMVGAPLATQFYTRYKQAKDTERSPILDPLNTELKKGKIYTPRNGEGSGESLGNIKKKKLFKNKRKSTGGWMYRKKASFSREGFRFAAHRHPSMNQISIDGSGFFNRRNSEDSSGDSSDGDLPTIKASPQHLPQSRRSIGGFFSRLFGSAGEENLQILDAGVDGDEKIDSEFSKSYEEVGGSNDSASSQTRHESRENVEDTTAGVNMAFDPDKDGLYNLGK